LKADYFYFERRIAEIDRTLSNPKSEEMDRAVLREEKRKLYDKRRRRRDQLFANAASHLAREFLKLGVSTVFVGNLLGLAREKPGKGNVNLWSYRKLIARIAITLENYGIAAFEVPENGTSSTCAWHGCKVVRKPRGLVKCPFGHVAHADLNAALNILKRGFGKVPERVRVRSFVPTASKVVPVSEKKKNHNPAPSAG